MSSDLMARLRRHYMPPQPWPGGVFVEEVGWNGGSATNSRCDAIYVGFTGTSGRRLVGHELKVSLADWRRELDQPGKADPWADQCHEWWIVAPSTAVVPPAELPAGWGLMVPNARTKTRMDKVVRAETRTVDPSWHAVRSLMSRIDTVNRSEIAAEVQRQVRAKTEAIEAERTAAAFTRNCPKASEHETLREVEKALGVIGNIGGYSTWGPEGHDLSVTELRLAVDAVREGRDLRAALERISGYPMAEMRNCLKSLDEARAKVAAALEGQGVLDFGQPA